MQASKRLSELLKAREVHIETTSSDEKELEENIKQKETELQQLRASLKKRKHSALLRHHDLCRQIAESAKEEAELCERAVHDEEDEPDEEEKSVQENPKRKHSSVVNENGVPVQPKKQRSSSKLVDVQELVPAMKRFIDENRSFESLARSIRVSESTLAAWYNSKTHANPAVIRGLSRLLKGDGTFGL
jgi:hypothetical protein